MVRAVYYMLYSRGMVVMLGREEYLDYVERYNEAWKYLFECSMPLDEVVMEICSLRGYDISRMGKILRDAGFIFLRDGSCDFDRLRGYGSDLGLYSKGGSFILGGRFIFPVKDMLGNVVALIGWYPDEKKYVTTPSRLFSTACMFYGMESLGTTGVGRSYYLVEGIFDCLSMRSLGLNCVAMMGVGCSRYKTCLYTLFKDIIAIPDADNVGRKVLLNDEWSLPLGSKYFKWQGINVKDIDALINMYDYDDVKRLLLDIRSEKARIVTATLNV